MRLLRAAACAFFTFRLAACVCFLVAIAASFRPWSHHPVVTHWVTVYTRAQRPSGVIVRRYAARLRGLLARSQIDPGRLEKYESSSVRE